MKKNIIIYATILILACALTATITYIAIDKQNNQPEIKDNDSNNKEETKKPEINDDLNNKEENNDTDNKPTLDNNQDNNQPSKPSTDNKLQDGIKLIKTADSNNKILQEYEVILNGKKSTINIVYTYKYTPANEYEDAYEEVSGTLNGKEVYYKFNLAQNSSNKNQIFNSNFIASAFNTKNFKIVKGEDNKNYLTVASNKTAGLYIGNSNVLYIYNDKIEQIVKDIPRYGYGKDDFMTIKGGPTGFELEDDSKWYSDTFNVCSTSEDWCHIGVKIEADKIYNLVPILNSNFTEGNMGKMEERVYTINNDKLQYKVLNSYKIVNGAGQI